jgi:hypothetical protein
MTALAITFLGGFLLGVFFAFVVSYILTEIR